MPFAPNYTPTTSFVNDEANTAAGRSTVRTGAVDVELANISASISALKTNLQALQRDDNKAKDYLIEPYALAEQTRVLLAAKGLPRGNWVTGTSYAVGDTVQNASIAYVCFTPHVSSTPFTSPGLWMALSSNGDAVGSAIEAGASKVAALASQTAAASSAANAANNATASEISAVVSLTRSQNAAASQAAAAGSAAAAASSATTAQASAQASALRGELAASGGSGLVGWARSAIGSVARWVADKLSESVSVLDFMTAAEIADVQSRARTINVTAKVQAAINHAQLQGLQLFVPAGDYLISSLVMFKGIRLYGSGISSVFVVASTVGALTDIITISPDALNDNACYGYRLEKFKITPQSGTPGRHGIAVDIRTSYVAYSSFEKLFISGLGGRAFATLPAATPRIDGFFTSSIEKCVLNGGIYLDKAGDSLRIKDNTITGPNVGVYADLVNTAFDGGAHGLQITGNNITSNGGALRVLNAWAGCFENNNCELPTPAGVANAAMIDIDGYVGNKIMGFVIANNYLGSAVAGFDTIRVNYAKGTLIERNYVSRPAASKAYVVTVNAQSTQFLHNIDALDETVATVMTDNGLQTLFLREFGGDLESTSHYAFTKANRVIKWIDSAGNKKTGIGASAVDNTFNIGFQDAPANNGHLILWANGVAYARIAPDGRFAVGDSGDISAVMSLASVTKGFLPPRMTTTQKNAIATPTPGLVVFDTTLSKLCVSVAGAWQTITSA